MNGAERTCMSQLWAKFGMMCVYFWIHKCIVGIIHVCLRSINGSVMLSFGKFRTSFGEFRDKSRNGRGVKISPSKAGKCERLSCERG